MSQYNVGSTGGEVPFVYAVTGVAHSQSPYTVLSTDEFISCDLTAGAIVIDLPNAPQKGKWYIVKDKLGLSGGTSLTVTTPGGIVTIDGVTTYTLNSNYESIEVIFDGTNYEVF